MKKHWSYKYPAKVGHAWESGWEEREVVLEELGGRGTDRQTREWSGGWEGKEGEEESMFGGLGEERRMERGRGGLERGAWFGKEARSGRRRIYLTDIVCGLIWLKDYRFWFLSWGNCKKNTSESNEMMHIGSCRQYVWTARILS